MATTDSGDQHFYYNQETQFQSQNLSTFKTSTRTSQKPSEGYENVPNCPLMNGMNGDDGVDKTTEYLASLQLPDASNDHKRDSDKGKRFSWGRNKKSSQRDRSSHNGGRTSYDDKRLALNDSDDENLVPLRGASYWACCVSSRVQKTKSKRRDDKPNGLPDGFTGTSVTDPPQLNFKVNIFQPTTTTEEQGFSNSSLQRPTNDGQRFSPQIQTNDNRSELSDSSNVDQKKATVKLPDIQRDRLNSNQNNQQDSLRKVTPGIVPPPIEKDFSLPPFGSQADDSFGGSLQYPTKRLSNRESGGLPFVPAPEVPSPQYQEFPASQPDLNKRPAKSALKGGKNLPAVGRVSDPSSGQRMSDGSSVPEAVPRGSVKGAPRFGGVRFGAAEEQGVVPSSLRNQQTGFLPSRNVVGTSIKEEEDNNPDYDNINSEDSDGDVQYSDKPSGLGAKVARNDSLAKFLSTRAERQRANLPYDCNVIPQRTQEELQELRQKIGSQLNRRLSQRPTAQELEEKHILLRQTPEQIQRDREEIKKTLIRKLSFRPTVGELKERRIIKFNDYVEVTEVEEYDRSCEKPWTKLTPKDKAAIRKELNEFKSMEMEVHELSKQYTRFHQP